MMFDDDYLWVLAKQEVQIGQNLKLIDQMVDLGRQNYNKNIQMNY